MRHFTGLVFLALALPAAAVEPPDYLSSQALEHFERFRESPEHRAFALGGHGAWGLSYDHATPQAARQAALGYCREFDERCAVIAVDRRIVAAADPFPSADRGRAGDAQEPAWFETVSAGSADVLAAVGLVVLVVGTLVAERYPLMARNQARVPFGRQRGPVRINYAYVIVAFLYFMALMPTFSRNIPAGAAGLVDWFWFGLPIVPPAVAALYLQARGRLGEHAS